MVTTLTIYSPHLKHKLVSVYFLLAAMLMDCNGIVLGKLTEEVSFQRGNFIFTGGEHKFKAYEHIFKGCKHKFTVHKHKIYRIKKIK